MNYLKELEIAQAAALQAGEIQLKGRQQPLAIDTKSDDSPVTQIDKQCEQAIREVLLSAYPDDGFLGEEHGRTKGNSGRTWIVDPIDGTRPYIRGIPTYSVLISLEDASKQVVGIMHFPALQETYKASQGNGAYCNESPIQVSKTSKISNAMGSAFGYLESTNERLNTRTLEIMKKWGYAYGFMDAYTYACIASGKIDACINLLDKSWDCAAAACIVQEAGGAFSDLSGNDNVHSGGSIITNGLLQSTVLELLAES